MKYTLTINQKAIIDNDLDLDIIEASLLNVLMQMTFDWEGMTKIQSLGKEFYWFDYNKLLQEAPLLRSKKDSPYKPDTIYRYMAELANRGYLEAHPDNKKLKKPFYALTAKCHLLLGSSNKSTTDKNPNTRTEIRSTTENYPYSKPFTTDKNPYNNNTNIDYNTKDIAEVKTSHLSPEQFGISEHIENPEQLPTNVKNAQVETKSEKYLNENQVKATPTPEGINEGLFLKLRDFAVRRVQRKAKEFKLTAKGWQDMIKELAAWLKLYSVEILAKHLDNAHENGSNWKSPFFDGVGKKLEAIKNDFQMRGLNTAQSQPQPNNEPPFENPEYEEAYQNTLKVIAKECEILPSTRIRNLNREEWAMHFVPNNEMSAKFDTYFNMDSRKKMYRKVLLKIATDSNTQRTPSTLSALFLAALENEKSAIQNARK